MDINSSRTLLVPPSDTETGRPARIRKVVLLLTETGKQIPVSKDSFCIGSAMGCDLQLSDKSVSRRHCRIGVDPNRGYYIEDLGSTNGTFVNGIRISHAFLTQGADLQLGNARLQFDPLDESRPLEQSDSESFGVLVGRSPAMRRVFHVAETYAPTDATVMLTGETGTGKEVLAEEIHRHSPRAAKPFIVIDCASLSRELIESELFGHVRGAFTGAAHDRVGAFEEADGGTVFLDEIGDLPSDLQPKLLRVLERREVRRVGSNDVRKVDVRILCATNKRLDEEVNAGRFREDLFYRLSVVSIELPPLRRRLEDIPLLVEVFAKRLHSANLETDLGDLRSASEPLLHYPWPGNVRELRNLVDRAFYSPRRPVDLGQALAQGRLGLRRARESGFGESGYLPWEIGSADPNGETPPASFKEEKQKLVDSFERRYFSALLQRNGGNVSKTAREAGIERAYLQRLIKKLGIAGANSSPD